MGHVTLPAPRIFRWLPDFCKICAPLFRAAALPCFEGSWFKSRPEDVSCFFSASLGTFINRTSIWAVLWLGRLIAGRPFTTEAPV